MKTKALIIGIVLGVLVLVTGTTSWAGGRVGHGQVRQHNGFTARGGRHVRDMNHRTNKRVYSAKHKTLSHDYHRKLAYRHPYYHRYQTSYCGYHLSGKYFGPYYSFTWSTGSW